MLFEKRIVEMYKGMMYTRQDDNGTAFYFSAEDFPGLRCEPYSFKAAAGHTLQGYIYSYDNPIEKRLVVFDHGFGGGHRSYMKEIEKLCAHGFTVFAYDHTGCMQSGGDTPNGMAQSLCDLNDCLTALKADDRFIGCGIAVMGHSWGGFSTMNICTLHPDITHAVVISGFISVQHLVGSYFSGLMKAYRKAIMRLERESNPIFVDYNGVVSLAGTKAKTLLIYSDNDKLCSKTNYDILKRNLEGRKENVKLMLVNNKGHNPNYTEDAVAYLAGYVDAKAKLMKKKKLSTDSEKRAFLDSFDWHRMTAQDEAVWAEIFKCLDN